MEKFSELKYTRPDMETVMEKIKADTEALKTAPDYAAFKAAYLDSVQIDVELSTARQLAYIRNSIDMLDPYYEEEMAYFDAWMPRYEILVKDMETVILDSPFRRELEEEFGAILIKNMEVRQLVSSEAVVEDKVKEAAACNRYSKTVAAASVDFRGETCNTYGLLKHMQSTDRQERKEAFKAWADLYVELAPELDKIYDELVHLRDGMAKKLGFDSFTPLAYYQRRRYDYNAEDLKVFRRQVREVIVPACVKLFERQREELGIEKLYYYDESLTHPDGNPVPIGDRDYMVGKAQHMYRELSAETGEFFDFMVEHELFDLETKKGKRVGGYCTSLPLYHAPFIFSNFNGTDADVNVLTHEAGHAFAGFTSSKFQKLPELCHSTSEINEIHSMSMELWTYPWMEDFFGEKAGQHRKGHLAFAMTKIPYMVCVDEFQHRVYEKPDMTAKERRAVWKELETIYMPWRDYGDHELMAEGGFWMQKLHIFLYPFYYVDYAMAQIGAFEFYTKMKQDWKSAWADYYKLCQTGGSVGYFELLKASGLHNLLTEGAVKEAVKGVFEELDL